MNEEQILNAIRLIAIERYRQIEEEGFSQNDDIEWKRPNELAQMAATYALPPNQRQYRNRPDVPDTWPMGAHYKPKPFNRLGELVMAGALIVAEIERTYLNME